MKHTPPQRSASVAVVFPAAVCLAFVCGCMGNRAVALEGQDAGVWAGARPAFPETPADTFPPLVFIAATASAERLVHHSSPDVRIRFTGNASDTLRSTLRTNLPDDIEPGTVYRNVRVHFELRVAFDSLASALDSLLRTAPRRELPVPDHDTPEGGRP